MFTKCKTILYWKCDSQNWWCSWPSKGDYFVLWPLLAKYPVLPFVVRVKTCLQNVKYFVLKAWQPKVVIFTTIKMWVFLLGPSLSKYQVLPFVRHGGTGKSAVTMCTSSTTVLVVTQNWHPTGQSRTPSKQSEKLQNTKQNIEQNQGQHDAMRC